MSQDLILADGTMIHLTGIAERDNIILLSKLRTIANDYASLKEDILLNGFQEDYYQRTILLFLSMHFSLTALLLFLN